MAKQDILEFLFVGPLYSIYKVLNQIRRELRNVATQAEVNALSERLGAVSTQLGKGFGEVQTEIQRLKDLIAAGEPIDLSTLDAQIGTLAGQAESLDSIVPDVVPDPEPEPEPPVEGENP